MSERIYLDSCVLNRPTDDHSQEQVRIEALAVADILDEVGAGQLEWIASTAVYSELARNPHQANREDSLVLLSLASIVLAPSEHNIRRAAELQQSGYGPMDALHLVMAEEARAAVLLTVDDRFLRRAAVEPGRAVHVQNPVDWLRRRRPWLIKR